MCVFFVANANEFCRTRSPRRSITALVQLVSHSTFMWNINFKGNSVCCVWHFSNVLRMSHFHTEIKLIPLRFSVVHFFFFNSVRFFLLFRLKSIVISIAMYRRE